MCNIGREAVCVNCRGAQGAGNQKCPVRERQVEVTRVRVALRVSYAEAVKKVEEDGSRVRDPERICVSSRSVPTQRNRPTTDICLSKIGFLAFIAMVINCTQGWKVR